MTGADGIVSRARLERKRIHAFNIKHLKWRWEQLEDVLSDCDMEIRRIKNSRVTERIISAVSQDESLENLEPTDVFARCLEAFDVPYDEREDLTASHDEVIRWIHEQDSNAQ